MIERFNFYDIYGYFIPGALLAFLLWLPHGLVNNLQIPADLTSAIIGIVLAYIAGHLLQIGAAKLLPHKVRHGNEDRSPSDLLLEASYEQAFKLEFRQKIVAAIQSAFELDTTDRNHRDPAIFLCRSSVLASQTPSYIEQFEGMYTLIRGVSAAAAVGCAYTVGWLISSLIPSRTVVASAICFIATAAGAYLPELEEPGRWMRRALATVLLAGVAGAGALVCGGASGSPGGLAAAVCVTLIISLWAFGSYHAFTWRWARAVYQDFYRSSSKPRS